MKTLKDGKQVSSRIYYYLLDFNERHNWEFMFNSFAKRRLCDLNLEEFKSLFAHAVEKDKEYLDNI